MATSVRVKLFLLANVNRLAIMTLRTVEVNPPVYKMTSDAAYAHCIRFWQCALMVGTFCKFYSDFLLFFLESNFGKLYIIGFLKVCSLLL